MYIHPFKKKRRRIGESRPNASVGNRFLFLPMLLQKIFQLHVQIDHFRPRDTLQGMVLL